MKYPTLRGGVIAVALALTACATAPSATEAPTEPPTHATEVTVQASQNPEFGNVLMDGERISLYVFTKDTPNGASACAGDCAEEW